jgi:hypothetical protein
MELRICQEKDAESDKFFLHHNRIFIKPALQSAVFIKKRRNTP